MDNQDCVELGYWGIRGLAEPIRLVLEACNIKYKERKYYNQEGLEEWLKVKPTLNTSFPNLPYLIDGDNTICESQAIIHYILLKANRLELLGNTHSQQVMVQQVLGVAQDLNNLLVRQSYNPKYKDICQATYDNSVVPSLNRLNAHFLKHNTQFMTGDHYTLADIKLFEILQHTQHHYKDCFQSLEGINTFINNMMQLQFVQNYRQSDRYIPTPFNNPFRAAYP